jgi:LmbE family N-acetylglucosaminyl deacetylase/predicted acetyltransferase
MNKILVVAAHPDDEILGVGATIAKRIKEGDLAYALILAEGQTSRWDKREYADKTKVFELHRDTYESAQVIGYKEVFFGNMPDNRMDSFELLDIVKIVEKYINIIHPDIIYTHHYGDLNIDHMLTYRAVKTATRPIAGFIVKQVYTFQTVSSTEWNFGNKGELFSPNVFIDISNTIDLKNEAMRKYKTELREFPHPRSIEMLDAVAKYWGGVSGTQYAEAFELVRSIESSITRDQAIPNITLREISQEDIDLLFSWANEEQVRENAFNTAEISYEEHKMWFGKLFNNKNKKQYICMYNGKDAGQIRLDIEGNTAYIDYSVDKNLRGQGIGIAMLKMVKDFIKRDFPKVKNLAGRVKHNNTASENTFLSAGFKKTYSEYSLLID